MNRQVCSIKPEDVATVRSSELLAKLELQDLYLILRESTLCWFGHVECSSGAIRTACDIQIDGRRGGGGGGGGGKEAQPNMEETDGERLPCVEAQDRSTWRSGLRFAMLAASQLL